MNLLDWMSIMDIRRRRSRRQTLIEDAMTRKLNARMENGETKDARSFHFHTLYTTFSLKNFKMKFIIVLGMLSTRVMER